MPHIVVPNGAGKSVVAKALQTIATELALLPYVAIRTSRAAHRLVRGMRRAIAALACAVGPKLDTLITRAVPSVRKAVKWNTPLYGVEDHIWFLSFHCFTTYLKWPSSTAHRSLLFRLVCLSKQKQVRYLDIREDKELDERQFVDCAKQAGCLVSECELRVVCLSECLAGGICCN